MIKKLRKSLRRKAFRRDAKKNTLQGPFNNEGVINLHVSKTENAGDYWCGPHHYYEDLNAQSLHIYDYYKDDPEVRQGFSDSLRNNSIIIGGGGLFNRNCFAFALDLCAHLAEMGKKTVVWGTGHNSKKPNEFGNIKAYNIDPSIFGLVGMRDYGLTDNYLPCVSCKHTLFDKQYNISEEVGVVLHWESDRQGIPFELKGLPYLTNKATIEQLVDFIGKHETLITDSYHVMYWSTMLERQVVTIPNSSKFYDFKYPPIITTFADCLTQVKNAKRYTGVLEESRELNDNFHRQTLEYLNND